MTTNSPQMSKSVPRISYSQNLEDILLDRVFRDRVGTYMDIGAHHPVLESNTHFFHELGWRGTNIEPMPGMHRLLVEERAGDLNLNVAVSDTEGEMVFYEVADSTGLSTLSAEVALRHRARGRQVVERQVRTTTIGSLIEEHRIAPPDLLSIDVENHEGQVLAGMPFETWRPAVLVIESILPGTNRSCHAAWEPGLLKSGYRFAAFNGVNRFYVREDLPDWVERLSVPVNVLDGYERHDRIDADNLAKLKKLFDSLDSTNAAYVMKCLCVASAPGETATAVDHVRLFRNDPRHRWKYRVHEQILPATRATNGEVRWSDVVIQHTGYTDPAALLERKHQRDLRLLHLEQEEHPDDPYNLFNLGQAYRDLHRPREALAFLRRSLELSNVTDSIVRKLYSLIAFCHQELKEIPSGAGRVCRGTAALSRRCRAPVCRKQSPARRRRRPRGRGTAYAAAQRLGGSTLRQRGDRFARLQGAA